MRSFLLSPLALLVAFALASNAEAQTSYTYPASGSGGGGTCTSVLVPAALSANTNDYNPSGFGSTTCRIRLHATGNINLTGLAAQPDGTVVTLEVDATSFTITLTNLDGGSQPANEFNLAPFILNPVQLYSGQPAITLIYDSSQSLWMPAAWTLTTYYQQVQSQGTTSSPQRQNLSFDNGFTVTDSSLGGGRKRVAAAAADTSITVSASGIAVSTTQPNANTWSAAQTFSAAINDNLAIRRSSAGALLIADGGGSETSCTIGAVAVPTTIHGAVTLDGAGTALTVNNNALISGTLQVTGAATLNGVVTLGSNTAPAAPTGNNLAFSNVMVANQPRPYFRNSNYSFALGFCPDGATNRWMFLPQASHATIAAGGQIPDGLNIGGHIQWSVGGGGGCTFPAPSGTTYQTRAPHAVCSSAGTTARTFGDIFSGVSASTGEGFVTTADGFRHVTTISTSVNIAQEFHQVGFGRVYTNGDDTAAQREGIWFAYETNVSSQAGNWGFYTVSSALPPSFTRVDLSGFPRSTTNVYQLVYDAPPGLTNGVGYQICDFTTPSIGATANCVRGVATATPPGSATELVLEELVIANPAATDGGPGLDGAATSATTVNIFIYDELGCSGWYGLQ